MLRNILFILNLLLFILPGVVIAADDAGSIDVNELRLRTRYKVGAEFERLPDRKDRSQNKENGLFTELGFEAAARFGKNWSAFTDIRGFAATSQISSTFDDLETGRTERTSGANSYLQLRRLWLRYHGLTDYPNEHLTLGLQRIKASSSLWWNSDIESLVWHFSSTRFRFQGGLGERFDTYRTNNELSQIDENKFRVFAETIYDWKAYHELNFRAMSVLQNSDDIPEDVGSGAPDGTNGEWFWYGIGLSSNWAQRRSKSPFAYNVEWIGLTGQSDFRSESGLSLNDHDISAWAIDVGLRYDLSGHPASFGITFSQGSGGFDNEESNLFVQTGLQSNRDRYVGTRQFLYRFNDALQPDLTNLIHGSLFASYTFKDEYLLAGSVSKFQRDDTLFPLYRNSHPLEMNQRSDDVGSGIDLSFRHDINTSVLRIPLKYWRVRSSAFLPGDAFNDDSDDTVYRVVLELVGVFE